MSETTTLRAISALVVGAVTGSGLFLFGTLLATLIRSLQTSRVGSFPTSWRETLGLLLVIYGITFIYFAVGLTIVGAPLWRLAHRVGHRSRLDALILGAGLSFICYLFLVAFQVVPSVFGPGSQYFLDDINIATQDSVLGWLVNLSILVNAVWIGVSGAVAGLTIWAIAYWKRTAGKS